MKTELAEYLRVRGPQLSGPLAAGLAAELKISPSAARKRIERREPPVRALDLQFFRGAQFLYLEGQYGSPQFWRSLAAALSSNNGAYARAIRALDARGGVTPLAHFAAAAGTSSGQRQLTGDVTFGRLVSAGLLQELELPGLGTCVAFAKGDDYLDRLLPEIRARLISETVLLQSIQEWAAKLGLGSFHSFRLRSGAIGSAPEVGTFAWDLTAPSYLGPLANWSNPGAPKPGFVVVDVLLTDLASAEDVQPFLHKCSSLRQFRSVGRCLQFFVAHRYSKDALNLIRRAGVVPATPESLFGTEVARALIELASTLSQAANRAVDPEKFEELFSRLGKAEAAAGTLRGALFEYVVADVVRKLTPAVDITMNKIYRQSGKDVAEVDVRAIVRDREIRFIECKGILPGNRLSDKDVHEWLNRRIPIVRSHTLQNRELERLDMKFEMWVTGELSLEVRRGFSITVLYAADIESLVAETNDQSLRKVVNQHFLRAPLAFPEDIVNMFSKRSIPQNPFAKFTVAVPSTTSLALTYESSQATKSA